MRGRKGIKLNFEGWLLIEEDGNEQKNTRNSQTGKLQILLR